MLFGFVLGWAASELSEGRWLSVEVCGVGLCAACSCMAGNTRRGICGG
jgi:hypothetical protein